MWGHINAAKEQVKTIVDDIKITFLNEAEVRIAVVGYKDHDDGHHIQFLDFTPSADQVYSFLEGLTASGGGDLPEDVLGGIHQALNLTWKQQTRCIVHIADAPPHGRTLQNEPPGFWDSFPVAGSEPHGYTYEPLLKQMVALNINYALLRINNTTDRMAFAFYEQYAAVSAGCKLLESNAYYSRARDLQGGLGSSSVTAGSGLLFEETELGTTFSALRHLVVKMVTTSASRTAIRLSTRTRTDTKPSTNYSLVSIDEDDEEEDEEEADNGDVQLDTTPPQWDQPGWLNESVRMRGFSPDIVEHGAGTLDNMMADNDNIKINAIELTIHKRSRPFAQGALRVASYACTASSTNRFVIKSFKRDGKRLVHVAEDMRCQALCKAFALEFNGLLEEEYLIDFIVTTCLAAGHTCMSLEPFIPGEYVKYNNNHGYVKKDNSNDHLNHSAQAFSHFTFERSRGAFLVSDLQGVGYVLTDPVIHTRDPKHFALTDTNLGVEGFKYFFATHVCNDICRKLGLRGKPWTIGLGSYEFRASWPSVDKTVCCSNKLCGRILHLASAETLDKFPGYYWCDTCWPQLLSSITKRTCTAQGRRHEFDASEFFSESQGQNIPSKCPKHLISSIGKGRRR
jgi:hypothetical protein